MDTTETKNTTTRNASKNSIETLSVYGISKSHPFLSREGLNVIDMDRCSEIRITATMKMYFGSAQAIPYIYTIYDQNNVEICRIEHSVEIDSDSISVYALHYIYKDDTVFLPPGRYRVEAVVELSQASTEFAIISTGYLERKQRLEPLLNRAYQISNKISYSEVEYRKGLWKHTARWCAYIDRKGQVRYKYSTHKGTKEGILDGWENIVQITTFPRAIMGLRSDGKVLYSGNDEGLKKNIETLTDIKDIMRHTPLFSDVHKDEILYALDHQNQFWQVSSKEAKRIAEKECQWLVENAGGITHLMFDYPTNSELLVAADGNAYSFLAWEYNNTHSRFLPPCSTIYDAPFIPKPHDGYLRYSILPLYVSSAGTLMMRESIQGELGSELKRKNGREVAKFINTELISVLPIHTDTTNNVYHYNYFCLENGGKILIFSEANNDFTLKEFAPDDMIHSLHTYIGLWQPDYASCYAITESGHLVPLLPPNEEIKELIPDYINI